MRILKSTQIAIGAAVIGLTGIVGFRFVSDRLLGDTHFVNLAPGKVNIIGIETGKGYAIRVVNQVAQLVEAQSGSLNANEDVSKAEGAMQGNNPKRVPIRDLLLSLQGDEKALGEFIMIMNDRGENDTWPPRRNIWHASDILKALNGDPALTKKLTEDLNINLDGTPMAKMKISAYQNGIIVAADVPVQVMVGGKLRTLQGHIQTPYRPELMLALDHKLDKKSDITPGMIVGYYADLAAEVQHGDVRREDVRKSLHELIDPQSLAPLADRPSQILNSAKVIVTDAFITGSSYTENGGGKDASYDLTLDLNDEGRRRLWAYSIGKNNAQLLLISDGIAIAAPRIRTELATSELTITQMHDKSLLDDMLVVLHKGVK